MNDKKNTQSDAKDLLNESDVVIDNSDVIEEHSDGNDDQSGFSLTNLLPTALVALLVSVAVVAAAFFLREPLGWNDSRNQAQSIAVLSENLQGRLSSLEKEIQGGQSSTAVAGMQKQLQTMKSELTKVMAQAAASASQGVNPQDLTAVAQQVAALKTDLDRSGSKTNQLSNQMSSLLSENKALKAALATVSTEMSALGQKQVETGSTGEGQASALLVTATQIKLLADTGKTFNQELQVLQKLAGQEPAILEAVSELTPFAKSGVATLATLKASFPTVIKYLKTLEATENQASLLDAVLGQVSSVVTVRRTEGAEGLQDVDGAIARTSMALVDGNLSQAINELKAMDERFSPATADWVARASDSEKASSLAAKLQLDALQAFSQ